MISSNPALNQNKSDLLGAMASGLCLIHCLATPFLFVAHAGAHVHHAESPVWWGFIDLSLLLVSLLAVYWTARNTSKQWMKIALSTSWMLLALIILNEKVETIHIAEAWIYTPTVSLVVLHLYNLRYCQCADETCTTTEKKAA